MAKLGFQENRVNAPQNAQELIEMLSRIMASAINNEVNLENAKVAINAATRIVDVWQADTRMKAIAIASNKQITNAQGWSTIDITKPNPILIEEKECV
jgi:hypothetical protein